MKTCFIKNCDRSCKFDSRRSLFTIPKVNFNSKLPLVSLNHRHLLPFFQSDPLRSQWLDAIPQDKRPIRPSDRICCRHFNEDDIDRYWCHTVNGDLVKMMRDRPILKKDAVPSQNLIIDFDRPKRKKVYTSGDEAATTAATTTTTEPSKKSKKEVALFAVSMVPTTEPEAENTMLNLLKGDDMTVKDYDIEIVKEPLQIKDGDAELQLELKKDAFEVFYDEIFDVTLPSPLWGLHRDPDGTFAVFSKVSFDKLQLDRAVRVNDNWEYVVKVGESTIRSDTLKTLDPDAVAKLLDEVDEIAS